MTTPLSKTIPGLADDAHEGPEAVARPEVLDAVAVHEAPVPRRTVRVVAHNVQVQRVIGAVDGGDAAEVSELLVVVLVGRTDLVKVLTRPRLLGEGSNQGTRGFRGISSFTRLFNRT